MFIIIKSCEYQGEEYKKDDENKDAEKGDNEEKDGNKSEKEPKKEEEEKDKSNEEKEKEDKDSDQPEKNDSEKEEKKGEEEKKEEKMETEIDNSLEEDKNAEKVDISEHDENSYIYDKNLRRPIILEDQTLKDRNKVKSTLYRYIFTNVSQKARYFRAEFKEDKDYTIDKLAKINYFIPPLIKDEVKGKNNVNFYNVARLKKNLPFIKRNDITISINFEK